MLRVATDIGGTFTDFVIVDQDGNIKVNKSHSTPPNFELGILNGLKDSNISIDKIKTFIHGTTVVVNAITERKGVKTGLITTKGFRDILEIGRGNRPDLFNLLYKKPEPFIPRYLRKEIDERVLANNSLVKEIDFEEVDNLISFFKKEKVEAIAISLLHSYKNDTNEKKLVDYIRKAWPEIVVTASHELTNEWREYERTSTTVLNSYVMPLAGKYVKKLEKSLSEMKSNSNKFIMQSNGGTTTFEGATKSPINLLESGPVAGVIGASILGDIIGEKNIISLDIGGTTAKCSLIDNGEVKVTTDYNIEKTDKFAGYPVKMPVVDIIEIGNGGGSIAWNDNGVIKVGPQSAGALPGPIAYNKGGTNPTTTDANLIVGRLSPHNFEGEVDLEEIKKYVHEKIAKPFNLSVEEAALGIVRIANSNMLNALKLVSVRKGYDPREFTLVATGGGGAMHAAALAEELGVKKVVIPFAASVFSAWGMLMTELRHDYVHTNNEKTSDLNIGEFNNQWELLEEEALERYKNEGIDKELLYFSRFVDMRYLGQEHTVKVPLENGVITESKIEKVVNDFHNLHEKAFTFKLENSPTEIVNLHLTAYGKVEKPHLKKIKVNTSLEEAIVETRPILYEKEGWINTKVYKRNLIPIHEEIIGPAIIEEKTSSTVVYKNQSAKVDDYGNIILVLGGE